LGKQSCKLFDGNIIVGIPNVEYATGGPFRSLKNPNDCLGKISHVDE